MRLGPISQSHSSPYVASTPSAGAPASAETSEQPQALTVEDEAPESLPYLEPTESFEDYVGILEGLSSNYLRVSQHLPRGDSPTLLDSSVDSSPLQLRELPSVSPRDWNSEPVFQTLHENFRQGIMTLGSGSEAQALLLAALQREDLLAGLCREAFSTENSSWEKLRDWIAASGFPPTNSLIESLSQALLHSKPALLQPADAYSEAYFQRKYLHGLSSQAQRVLQKLYGSDFLSLPLRLRVLLAERNNAGYEWVQGEARLTLQLREPLGLHRMTFQQQQSSGPFGEDFPFRRGVVDSISFIHEYAHATFDAVLGGPVDTSLQRVGRSLSEGFAVLTELVAIDYLLRRPDDTMLQGDRQSLSERRRQRTEWLQLGLEQGLSSSQMPYIEGTELLTRLFREGGFSGVFRALRKLQLPRCNSLKRNNPAYREAIPDPEKTWELLSSK